MMTVMVFGDDDNAEVDHDKKDIVHNKDLLKDISVMQKVGAIDANFCNVLQKTFECSSWSVHKNWLQRKTANEKVFPFVEMSHNEKVFHIHKSTAVWLFQECARVSTDHLFRVQSKQPYSSSTKTISSQAKTNSPQVFTLPTKLQNIQIGDICVFAMQGISKVEDR